MDGSLPLQSGSRMAKKNRQTALKLFTGSSLGRYARKIIVRYDAEEGQYGLGKIIFRKKPVISMLSGNGKNENCSAKGSCA
jgi:hypothetical protein